MREWYYYLHTNGSLIGKNPWVVDSDPQYFDSPFVSRVWHITNQADFDNMIIEARNLGANENSINNLLKEAVK